MLTTAFEKIGLNDHELKSALKVSEQLLRETLKKDIDEADAAGKAHRDGFAKPDFKDYAVAIRKACKDTLNNAPDLSKFRLSYFALFGDSDSRVPASNYDMMDDEATSIFSRLNRYCLSDLKALAERGEMYCDFSFNREKFDVFEDVDLKNITFGVDLPKSVIDLINTTFIPHIEKAIELEAKERELKDRLRNIGETLSQIEAEIIVNTLSRDESGKRVLSVASGIISQVLGKSPALLTTTTPE